MTDNIEDVSAIDDTVGVLEKFDLKEINEAKQKLLDIKAELVEKSKQSFKDISAKLFEAYPELESFSWQQYTPYFNDGEPCEFGIYADDLAINGGDRWEYLDADGNDWYNEEFFDYGKKLVPKKRWDPKTRLSVDTGEMIEQTDYNVKLNVRPNPHYKPQLVEASKAASKLIYALDEDALKSMFGDHATITVHRDGQVDIDSCDHD